MKKAFKSKLNYLVKQKEAELGFSLQHSQIAQVTGVPTPTITSWLREDRTFNYVEANVLAALRKYFNCGFDDLVEVVDLE